jgi:peroxin-1
LASKAKKSPILRNKSPSIETEILDEVATSTEGYLGADLEQLIERSIDIACVRFINSASSSSQLQLTAQDFKKAQEGFVPISLKGIQLHTSEIQWKDIGGTYYLLQPLV